MILQLYAIRDRQVDSFMNPYFMLAHGQATRAFSDEVNRSAEDNNLYKHPDDFDLYTFGSFDTDTGVFSLLPRPEVLALAKNLKLNGAS